MNDKSVTLIVPGGADDEVRHILIDEKTTVAALLEKENLNGYQLSLGPGQAFLANSDSFYHKVESGDKVYATTKAQQG